MYQASRPAPDHERVGKTYPAARPRTSRSGSRDLRRPGTSPSERRPRAEWYRSFDHLSAEEKFRHRRRAHEAEQRDEERRLEVRAAPVAQAERQDREHRARVEAIERQHPVLCARPDQHAQKRHRHGEGQTPERKRQTKGEQRAHWKTSINARSYRRLTSWMSDASSSTSRMCRRSTRRSAESCTQAVPGVKVMMIARTASPFGSFNSRGISTNAERIPLDRCVRIARATRTFERSMSITTSRKRRTTTTGLRMRPRPGRRRAVATGQKIASAAPSTTVSALDDCMSRSQKSRRATESTGEGKRRLMGIPEVVSPSVARGQKAPPRCTNPVRRGCALPRWPPRSPGRRRP